VLELRRQRVDPETVGRREQPARGLLDPVAQRLRLPFGVPEFIERIVSGTTNEVGRRTLMMLITTWDMAGGGPFAIRSEPIASMKAEALADVMAPTLQRYLIGNIS
jgi:hypothetical protein